MKDVKANRSPLLLNSRQAAEELSISERKLWSLTASGDIPHIRIGRAVRYPADDLHHWIKERTQGGNQRSGSLS